MRVVNLKSEEKVSLAFYLQKKVLRRNESRFSLVTDVYCED